MELRNSDRIFNLFRGILKLLLVHSFIVIYIIVGGTIVKDLFITRRAETVSLTYYGFAIFAVFANICFSYSRSLDDKGEQAYLRTVGERFLFSAIGFLTGSLLNYISVNSVQQTGLIQLHSVFSNALEMLAGFFLTCSFFFAALTIHSILDHLFEKIVLNRDNYYRGK